ncbi:4-hydroxy-tetrahydrodipicolinate synthase [bacterium]|nr:4-hydroxy-tetrahydrodipicolinate synthase [bacterium]
MFKGSIVALVTPFTKDNRVDEEALRRLIDFQRQNGTDGILVIGCTGESFTLTEQERDLIIRVAREEISGDMFLLAGTGASGTEVVIERSNRARQLGADGALVITPFGNKPSQDALLLHYQRLAEAEIPIILYNVPSRTGTNLLPATVARLAGFPHIVAIKEASGNLDQVTQIGQLCDIEVLSGDDALTLPMLAVGGRGVISTCANIIPADMSRMIRSFFEGDLDTARKLHLKMFPLIKALFLEGNPVPLKAAMELAGMIEGNLRAPLVPISESNRVVLKHELQNYGLL